MSSSMKVLFVLGGAFALPFFVVLILGIVALVVIGVVLYPVARLPYKVLRLLFNVKRSNKSEARGKKDSQVEMRKLMSYKGIQL